MSNSPLIPCFVPSLSSILHRHELEKGSPLTEDEVNSIRDRSVVVMLPSDSVLAMEQNRGYQDVDPENCWHEWQFLRQQLAAT
ncbi:hypothetical protein Cylst_5922 [Cylindrospermum stagnale PCC 7417]|uniref:Uncharacterized protein n=1 Tax=Cylindrospermum stagnale PCC 7417 TaxID=56107 RepID=K9X5X5_9NOST|nr:hypothetical protein [Cylindrospermum stagnale]AFZ27898.1 hypothetical protein Cylst_5922 [Cylindrospermum stagnale PCC 7417]